MSEYIKGIKRVLSEEEIRRVIAKYSIGDMVVYLNENKIKKHGTIKEIEWGDTTPLYSIDSCSCLRQQKDILNLCREIAPRYKIGDKVYYINNDGVEKIGTIKNIEKTNISNWNDVVEPLYLVTGCLYLRNRKDIIGSYSDIDIDVDDYISL